MTTPPIHRRAPTMAEQVRALNRIQSGLTRVLVTVAVVALAFTATNVTLFAVQHHVSPWIAWLLDPMVAVALGAVLIVDGRLSEYGIRPSGWASALRWFAGLGTWAMNCWSSLWPDGSAFGVPRHVDPAGLVLHSIPPVLLIVLAEAITHYRRAILAKITELSAEVDGQESAPAPHAPAHLAQKPAPAAPDVPTALPAIEQSALVTARADTERAPNPHAPHTARTPEAETPDDALRREQFEEAELERMRQDARRAYVESAQAGRPVSARALGEAFGMSESWGRKQILAVRDEDEPSRPHLRPVETVTV